MERKPITLSPGILTLSYAVAPLFFLGVLADLLLFGGRIRAALPADPSGLAWFILIFNVPHQIASLFSFADREYLAHYRKKLFPGLLILLAAYGLLFWYSSSLAYAVLIAYTAYHLVAQQSGVLALIARGQSSAARAWKWLTVVLFAIGYGLALPDSQYAALIGAAHGYDVLPYALIAFFALSTFLVLRLPSRDGKLFAFLASASSLFGFAFLFLGYPFLAILSPRIEHDATAFLLYGTHDYNRNLASRPNCLYRLFERVRVPVYALTVALALLFAYVFNHVSALWSYALAALFVTHYYVEGFAWKRGGLHQKQIRLG